MMKKDASKMYAKALADIVASDFLSILEKRGDVKAASKIVALTEDILLKKSGSKKVVIESARQVNLDKLITFFRQQGDVVETKINPELIAGVRVTINSERQLDFSLKGKLDHMF